MVVKVLMELTEFYLKEINGCPVTREVLGGADMARRFLIVSDYSYFSDTQYGENFALIGDSYKFLDPIFTGLNIGGWVIAALSLLVGMFGVANIMFVTVRERTSQIGLKKAIGAKRGVIMTEFLLESAFLCIIGGLIGLLAVFLLTLFISTALGFKVFIPFNIIMLAISICLFTGVVAGIIPAFIAARMNPVVAIRSK